MHMIDFLVNQTAEDVDALYVFVITGRSYLNLHRRLRTASEIIACVISSHKSIKTLHPRDIMSSTIRLRFISKVRTEP